MRQVVSPLVCHSSEIAPIPSVQEKNSVSDRLQCWPELLVSQGLITKASHVPGTTMQGFTCILASLPNTPYICA